MTPRAVGVVGASARAAAMSLVRAGFEPWAVDLFADRDLRRIAPVARCPAADYPHGIPDLCDQFPPGPVLYTGGLENHPGIVAELAARRPLCGNGPDVLEQVRDPFRLTAILHGKAFAAPPVLPATHTPPDPALWLRKSFHSAGGLGVRFADASDEPSTSAYYQQYIDGMPMSALFNTMANKTRLLGITEQLVGVPWLHARPFRYGGNLGPVELPADVTSDLIMMGYRVQIAAGIRGLWGADFVLADGVPWVVEVNPRYTAGLEVIEQGIGIAVGFDPDGGPPPETPPATRIVGKAIYFAPHRITFPPTGPWDNDLSGPYDPCRLPGFADIPEAGEVIEAGWPVLTFFTTGSTPAECRERLQSRAADLDRLFAEPQR
jgi:predicted ATP-grasp superfamily ATP-dependent carboligase